MKTAIYVEDGFKQIVLTPEDKWERRIIELLFDQNLITMFKGEFYYCQGGWMREGALKESLIIKLDKKGE